MALPLDGLVAIVSGVPLVVLGGLLLHLRPRSSDQAAFGLFAVAWGLQIVAANVGSVLLANAPIVRVALLIDYGLLVVVTVLLVRFAIHVLPPSWRGVVLTAFAVPALLASATMALSPASVLADVAVVPGTEVQITLGPAATPLFIVPFFAAFYAALGILAWDHRRSEPGTDRRRARALVIALALFVSYASVQNLAFFLGVDPTTTVAGPGGATTLVALFGVGVALVAGIVTWLIASPPRPEGRDLGLVAAFALPAATAAAEATGLIPVSTLGLWRIAAVVVLAYTLARHRLFDLDLRAKRVAGLGAAALGLGLGVLGAVLLLVAGRSGQQAVLPVAIGAGAAGVSWGSRDRIGDRLFPGVRDEPAYRRQRKLDVYRGRLEEAARRGQTLDAPALNRERRRLGISEREHEVMAYLLTKEDPDEGGSSRARIEPGVTLADRYRIERLIGEGAHGRVFEAWDTIEERPVAAKVVGRALFAGRAAKRLLGEARTVADLDHPNVLDVHDVLERDREVVMITEYADGGDLADLIERRGGLGTRRAVELVDGVLAGLAAAHGAGVVHRDLKPENVLLVDDRPVVADFGVARRADREETDLAGDAIGTLLYTSPEQVRGDDVDARSDVYAAGVLLHLLATGRHVLGVAGRDDFQLRRAILEESPGLDLDDAPPHVRETVQRALSKDPADRFATAEAMRQALAGD